MTPNAERGTRNVERPVHALLLAAGSGSRFGSNKLLAMLRGRPLIAHAATAVAEAITSGLLAGGVAVIPSGATELGWPLSTTGLTLVDNPDAHLGIATSLRRGLEALTGQTPAAGAALIVLADQPGLRLDVIARLIACWRDTGRSARPRYASTPAEPGHPVLLDRGLWSLAARLAGDQGLRDLLAGESLMQVDVPGANPDVDTPADLRLLEEPR